MAKIVVLSATQLERLVPCSRAWALAFRVRLRRRATSEALLVGQAFHVGIAKWYTDWSVSEAIQTAREHLATVANPFEVATLTAEVERLLQAYPTLAGPQDEEDKLRPIAVENKFMIPVYRGPEGEVVCAGIIDMYADTKYGPCIVDHKTAHSCGASYFVGHEHSIQAAIYMQAATFLGIRATHFAWNVLAKTKVPYLRRLFFVPGEERLARLYRELAAFGKYLLGMPDELNKVVSEVVGMPGACSKCPYSPICDYPEHAEKIVEADFEIRTYEDFEGRPE